MQTKERKERQVPSHVIGSRGKKKKVVDSLDCPEKVAFLSVLKKKKKEEIKLQRVWGRLVMGSLIRIRSENKKQPRFYNEKKSQLFIIFQVIEALWLVLS